MELGPFGARIELRHGFLGQTDRERSPRREFPTQMNLSRLLKLSETNNILYLPLPRRSYAVRAGPGQIGSQASDYRAVLRARTPVPRPWRTEIKRRAKAFVMTFLSTRCKCVVNLFGGNASGRPNIFSVVHLPTLNFF